MSYAFTFMLMIPRATVSSMHLASVIYTLNIELKLVVEPFRCIYLVQHELNVNFVVFHRYKQITTQDDYQLLIEGNLTDGKHKKTFRGGMLKHL